MEIWKEIPGTDGCYEISNIGRLRRGIIKSHAWLTKTGKILHCYKRPAGYLFHVLYLDKKKFHKTVHGLVCSAFLGPVPEGKCVNHKNGIKTDNRIENLEYVTFSKNNIHASRFLNKGIGETHGMSRLTEKNVKFIRNYPYKRGNRKDNSSNRFLADKFGMSLDTIQKIRRRLLWNHI